MTTGFVALLDVLGFSALLSDEGGGQHLQDYLRCLNEALNVAAGRPQAPQLDYVVLDAGGPRQLGHQKIRNEVANLPQQVHFCGGWNVFVVFFHPCCLAGLRKTFQLFSKSYGMAVKQLHF